MAKKRGWRASMRKEKKDKFGDGASSAGWTDVSRESGMPGKHGEKEKEKKRGSVLLCSASVLYPIELEYREVYVYVCEVRRIRWRLEGILAVL